MYRTWRAAIGLVAALVLLPIGSAAAASPTGVIVQLRPGLSAGQKAGVLDVGRVVGRVFGTTQQVVHVTGDPATVAASLNRSALVQYAEVDKILHTTGTPNDPSFGQMYGMQKIQAPTGWDMFFGTNAYPSTGGAKVGIVDTGIRRTHQDLAGKVVDCATYTQPFLGLIGGNQLQNGTCNDGNGHGTHVAGTITANTNNAIGVAGVAFNSPLAICKGLDDSGSGATSVIASCIRWVKDRGAKVISMSLGGGASTTLQSAVQYAYANGNGAVVVAAAGNNGNSTVSYPAGYPEVVSVAATDQNDNRASFSNQNADVEVAAPGVNILSTWGTADNAYNTISGTSMATPHAAGVAALIASKNPSWTALQVRNKLDAAVDDLLPTGRDPSFGFGRVNVVKAAS
jgi:thermitase